MPASSLGPGAPSPSAQRAWVRIFEPACHCAPGATGYYRLPPATTISSASSAGMWSPRGQRSPPRLSTQWSWPWFQGSGYPAEARRGGWLQRPPPTLAQSGHPAQWELDSSLWEQQVSPPHSLLLPAPQQLAGHGARLRKEQERHEAAVMSASASREGRPFSSLSSQAASSMKPSHCIPSPAPNHKPGSTWPLSGRGGG